LCKLTKPKEGQISRTYEEEKGEGNSKKVKEEKKLQGKRMGTGNGRGLLGSEEGKKRSYSCQKKRRRVSHVLQSEVGETLTAGRFGGKPLRERGGKEKFPLNERIPQRDSGREIKLSFLTGRTNGAMRAEKKKDRSEEGGKKGGEGRKKKKGKDQVAGQEKKGRPPALGCCSIERTVQRSASSEEKLGGGTRTQENEPISSSGGGEGHA